ncbi:hypothetical protein BKA57DRAFT_489829 [Linnemannia elongata]|nr:hypothetical protein BKA57DRAFT_489829 [Linnemannia elongata]
MLRNTMTDNRLSLFCLVDGEATPFSVEVDRTKTIDHLKDLIKAKKTPEFDDIAADKLTLWRVSISDDMLIHRHVSIPDDNDNEQPILLDNWSEKKKLKATAKVSKVFEAELLEDTIHIIVGRPLRVNTPVPARALTQHTGHLSDMLKKGTIQPVVELTATMVWSSFLGFSVALLSLLSIVSPLRGNPIYNQGSLKTVNSILEIFLISATLGGLLLVIIDFINRFQRRTLLPLAIIFHLACLFALGLYFTVLYLIIYL